MSMSETMALSDKRAAQRPESRSDRDAPPEPQPKHGDGRQHGGAPPEPPPRKMRPGPFRLAMVVGAAALAGLAFWGISKRSATTKETQNVANEAAALRVD